MAVSNSDVISPKSERIELKKFSYGTIVKGFKDIQTFDP